ncbi:unnamed protein product [Brassica oleracea var. botrytis]|uniref:CCT domain-containing protein n=1 Tax=Brassica oleracea var. oleracea TaxID=109376 RepID=A0A0D3A6G3_BRAOL|nr:PREDICTED: protein CHLOROPLAST IMPORT APPARATUS 2 [Brassica oleracea var. oleracea]
MSSCLSGGGAYTFELEMMKSPPSRTAASSSHNTPSPSSTISESNSPPLRISTRRPRTQRKRPNQTYDEAAALLSTAYPNIFSSKRKSPLNPLFLNDYDEASQLLLPFESIEDQGFLFSPTIQTKPDDFLEHKEVSFDSEVNRFGFFEDFDAESILDEEIEEGIDSFMGSIESNDGESGFAGIDPLGEMTMLPWQGSSLGLRNSLRECDDASLWMFPTVELEHISPRIQTTITAAALAADDGEPDDVNSSSKSKTVAGEEKRKMTKKKNVDAAAAAADLKTEQRVSPLLKLDYDRVLEAWSDKESPFSNEVLGSETAGSDIHARLAEIDLFGESGMREAIVSRYKEKRRNRLFSNSKRIRYQVRKLSADQRPRMKGRFVRRSNIRNLGGLRL